MNELEKYIHNLRDDFEQSDFLEEYDSANDDEKLIYLYAYYHYFNADSSNIDEVIKGNVHELSSNDSIYGVYCDEESDKANIDVLLCKYSSNNEFDFPKCCNDLINAENVLYEYINKKKVREKLQKRLIDAGISFSEETPVVIKFITNYYPKNSSLKLKYLNALKQLKHKLECFSFDIEFGNQIEFEILEIEDPKEYVDKGTIQIDEKDNFTRFGSENSLIVNVSAKSIKKLYAQYSYRGLFAQNLRYYVKNNTVDSNIVSSIENEPNHFWYLNNGIIIICDDYSIHRKVINLSKFSIINGGQTTKIIGETDFDNDFFLQCKIIKNKYAEEKDKILFISNVAEASNTQKPIKPKDLIANRPEQRMLKKQLADVGVYCQIKRGEKVNKKLYPHPWQNTTNEELGQFLLAFLFQIPGAARGHKSSITGNVERYNLLFTKQYDSYMLKDFLQIKANYKLWQQYNKKHDEKKDSFRLGLINNGMFYITAIIGVICKLSYHKDYFSKINACDTSEEKMEILSQFDVNHRFLKQHNNYKESLFELFDYCYKYFLRPAYEIYRDFKNSNQYSNFTKTDSSYSTYVIKNLLLTFKGEIPEEHMEVIKKYLYQPTPDELNRDAELLNAYSNIVNKSIDLNPEISQSQADLIKKKLSNYRVTISKEKRIKPLEIFRNSSIDIISKRAPISTQELENLHCLDKTQFEAYALDIVNMVIDVLQEK